MASTIPRPSRALRLGWHFVRPYWRRLVMALLALVVTAGITLSMGQGIRLLVDQGFMTGSVHQLNQTLGLFLLLVLALAAGTFSRFYLVSWI
ncbi:MAG: ABC transporter ATP-binding protein, partial [Pseudomonas sp.]|nr:ABC transporter ATP-binding protein [Pseudomonas sp.]